MIVRLLKNSHPAGYVIAPMLLVIIATVWGAQSSVTPDWHPMPLYHLLSGVSVMLPEWLTSGLACILVGLQAFHWNKVVATHEVLYKKSLLPLLLFVAIAIAMPGFLTISPILFVVSLIVLICDRLFKIYKNPGPLPLIFDSAFLASLSALIWFPSIFLLPFIVIAVSMLKTINGRDLMIVIMGFSIPFFLVFVILFWFDAVSIQNILLPWQTLGLESGLLEDSTSVWIIGLYSFTTILSIWRINRNFYKNATKVRYFQQTVFLLYFFSLLALVFAHSSNIQTFYILSIPLTTMLSYYFLAGKNQWWAELLFASILAFGICVQSGLLN